MNAMKTGDQFTKKVENAYTNEDGTKSVHTFVIKCEVRETNSVGYSFTTIEILSEEGRPTGSITPREAPHSGTVAWFGHDAAVSRGDLVVL